MNEPDRQRAAESRIEALFDEVVDLSPGEQHERLSAREGSDRDVVAAVRRLLASLRDLPDAFLGGNREQPAEESRVPERIGGYRVRRAIGEGGMGIVYEAEQDSPRRRVALKVIRPEVATRVIRRRFAREAELLGRLQHPGIAHVYESGDAEVDGRSLPYFAMEYIDGEPLDGYARRKKLGLRQRLELVARVADAVQYAHVAGIVHRDLKPSNLLVVDAPVTRSSSTAVDFVDIGQPKVLDFGIARVVEAESDLTMQTHAGQIIGTLAYMSPEQVVGDSAQIDTRCDIYALGVILYELLVGRHPHELAGLSIVEAARIIREDEPTGLGSIDRSLRGDVSTIVGKALAKEKERRYLSASELAADLRRHLNDEPIEARPASTIYQLRKFARRNRALVGGVVTTFIALLLGLVGTGYYLVETNHALDEVGRTKREISKHLYGTRMILGAQAVEKTGALDRVRELVDLTRDQPMGTVRGWEWFYLLSECHREARILEIGERGESIDARPGSGDLAVATTMHVRVYEGDTFAVRWTAPVAGDASVRDDRVHVAWSPTGDRL
ncbi:MAG: serine/threonine protein kinase, partial [Planctomycetes bacterium]|nr:serine/threonine protein kinase [Planctomycetota bacterium]